MISEDIREYFGIVGNGFEDKRERNTYFRVMLSDGNRKYYHSLVFKFHNKDIENIPMIDHIDGNGLNNEISNLRVASSKMNGRNQRLSNANSSGRAGVYWQKSRSNWVANGKSDGKTQYLGSFKNFDDAVAAREKWEKLQGMYTERHGRQKDLED